MSQAIERTWKALDRRIRELERTTVRLRKGVMTSEGIDLGDSGVAHGDVAAVGTAAVGSTVSVLARGHGLLSLGQIGAGSVASSLPSSPSNGEVALYRPSTGVIWHCVYDSAQHTADGNGWVVVGGGSLSTYAVALQSWGSSSWVNAGITLPIPKAGVWDVTLGARLYSNGDNVGVGLSTTGAGTVDGNILLSAVVAGATYGAIHGLTVVRHALTVGTLYERIAKTNANPGDAYADYRLMRAMPVRLAS